MLESQVGFLDGKAESVSNSSSVVGVNLKEMLDHLLLNILAAVAKISGDVVHKALTLSFIENFGEEQARLLKVVIRMVVRVSTNLT